MQYALEVKKLTKDYPGKKSAIKDLDLKVPKGSIFGLLGPNGAGKSTLINILAGVVVKSSGQAIIMENDIDISPKAAKMKVGIVPQEIVIDSFFPLKKALEFTAGYYGVTKQDRDLNQILKALGLYDKRNSLPKQLSGGMRRRFLIAKAMVHSPGLLILDEPTAGVDIELRDQLWSYIRELNKGGTTIIITTHYLFEAQELCDQIAFINNGKIVHQDKTQNLLDDIGQKYIDIEFALPIATEGLKFKRGTKFAQCLGPNCKSFEILNPKALRIYCNKDGASNLREMIGKVYAFDVPIENIKTSAPDLEYIFKQIINK